jgi:hypothetical protein
VDIIFGAIDFAALLMFGIAVILAPGETAPGLVRLICGASAMIAGVAASRGADDGGRRAAGVRVQLGGVPRGIMEA